MSVLFEANHLGKTFRQANGGLLSAVVDLSFTIDEGSFVAITGPSGSGKTTLLSLLGGLDRPTSGSLLYAGRDLAKVTDTALARIRRQIGFVFQDDALLPRLSALDNIAYPLIPRGISASQRRDVAQQLLARLGIAEIADSPAGTLSGGERQRLSLARALAGQPRVILADEPTSNLDTATAEMVTTLLSEFRESGGTLVAVTHDPKLLELAPHTLRLVDGSWAVDA